MSGLNEFNFAFSALFVDRFEKVIKLITSNIFRLFELSNSK